MRTSLCVKAACLTGLLALAGCSSSVTAPEKYSGFLKNYSGIQETKSASGKTILRWVDPSFKSSNYDKLIFNPLTYYPVPKPTTQLGAQTLDKILAYANQQLKASAEKRIQLVSKPGPRTLIFHGAITGVDSSKQGLQFYEVIPVAMIVAGTEAATGHRTMETNLYFEGELIDSSTNKVVMKVVRKGEGKTVSNESAPITVDSLKSVIDDMATDASMFEVK
ncbi:DUF3313 domain-containing protein [Buttiauxella sp. A2-C1_F]|uniref:DUF3313 domain-containing protein n=1 Tax=unclassified Buttiauxella TaxID=2634062 RepID=UPI001E3405D2|nr:MULTISPECIES: DUF3313 domain-containing protein [unclassified Buttiauxella]MCE0799311.1 DUF3313 domain-containing protein [Buttiauxella sp. W03-F01]MCE0812265.1 DUF3313 domain-containing protein [Buttiauxella sp. S04-F03]MCE0845441.1 DUF3313 domain-containing protein [Buttiauxella sp. A2-C1_F]